MSLQAPLLFVVLLHSSLAFNSLQSLSLMIFSFFLLSIMFSSFLMLLLSRHGFAVLYFWGMSYFLAISAWDFLLTMQPPTAIRSNADCSLTLLIALCNFLSAVSPCIFGLYFFLNGARLFSIVSLSVHR